jgi:subtilisin family serine protease
VNPTNFADYLARAPESDLSVSMRAIIQITTAKEFEDLARSQLNLETLHPLSVSSFLVVQGPVKNLQKLAQHPSVQRIWKDSPLFLCSQQVLDAIGISTITHSWLKPMGKGVTVALIDSGIESSHPSLQGVVKTQKSFLPKEEDTMQLHPHGTALAGIIGGQKGIAPGVEFIDAQVFNPAGVAFLSDAVEALTWVATLAPAVILFGGVTTPEIEEDNPLATVCRQVITAGTTIIAPAGNFGPETATIGCPASVPGVIAVGAVTMEGEPAFFSSRGSTTSTYLKPDFVLPGIGIRTIVNLGGENILPVMTGTSAAAAICTGLLALILSGKGNIPPDALRDAVLNATEDIDQDPVSQGHGILNGITLARLFNIMHPLPDPFNKVVSSSLTLTLIVTGIVIAAFMLVSFLR